MQKREAEAEVGVSKCGICAEMLERAFEPLVEERKFKGKRCVCKRTGLLSYTEDTCPNFYPIPVV